MTIETEEQAKLEAIKIHFFMLGLDVGRPAHLGVGEMIRISYDLFLYFNAEKAEKNDERQV